VTEIRRQTTMFAADGRGDAPQPPFLRRLRKTSRAVFDAVGLPTTAHEEWRHTNIAPIARTHFAAAEPADADVAGHLLGECAAAEAVCVNGYWRPRLSRMSALPPGVLLVSLREAIDGSATPVHEFLGRLAQLEDRPFVAWNTSDFADGVLLYMRRGTRLDRPVHLLFLGAAGDVPVVYHPRVLIVAEEDVEASIVETYAGNGSASHLCNAVSEIFIGAGSRVDHYRMQREPAGAFHISATGVELREGASFVSHSLSQGARISRNELEVFLRGSGASATLNGLVMAGGEQLADNHTLLSHEKPGCYSHELYKHVLDGRATGVFKGKILVHQGAQKTDSRQTSKTLLLSDSATMHSQPALEIYADDVKCTHGSTTGPVDEEAVFYLRSRGLGLEAARHLLTYAFAADITRRIRVEAVRRRIEDDLASQQGLPLDLRITDAGQHDDAAL